MKKSWLLTCLINFLLASLMGLLLRLAHVFPLHFNYTYMIHAHSHTAMLGWVYMMIYCLFVKYFIPADKVTGIYNKLFWITQATVAGMMITFPFQGYALYSIFFSTAHILCSYYFCYRVWKDQDISYLPARLIVNTALAFMVLSTLGAWSLGIITGFGGKNSPLYNSAIQFFLHFQFNGWFIFAVLGLFFMLISKIGISINTRKFKLFYYLLVASVFLTLALPLGWYYPGKMLLVLNGLGTLVQATAILLFLHLVIPGLPAVINKTGTSVKWLLALSLISLCVKMLVQVTTIVPAIALASHTIRNLTIGFIHLSMLGVITGFLLVFLASSHFIQNRILWHWGTVVLFIGFVLTEVLLFTQGVSNCLITGPVPGYPKIILLASILLPLGLSLVLLSILIPFKTEKPTIL